MAAFLGIRYKGILGSGFALGQGGIILPSAPSYDPDAQVYFTAIEDAGGTLTDNVKDEFNAFVVREKDAGRWSNIKRLYPYLGGVINSAIIDAVTLNSATNTNFVDGDVDSLCGLQGDGSSKYLNLNTGLNSIWTTPFNIKAGYYRTVKTSASTQFAWGSRTNSSIEYVSGRIGNSSDIFNAGSAAIFITVSNTSQVADIIYYRNTSQDFGMYLNGVKYAGGSSTETYTPSSINAFSFALNNAGSPLFFSSEKSTGLWFFDGTESESVLLNESYKTFINNIQAYAAAQAYFTAVEAAGGTLTTNVKSEFSAFVSREVEAGRWGKIKRLYPYLGGVINSAIIDAVTLNSATNTNFVDGDVDSLIGISSDGSTKALSDFANADVLIDNPYDHQRGFFVKGTMITTSSIYHDGAITAFPYTNMWMTIRGYYGSDPLIGGYVSNTTNIVNATGDTSYVDPTVSIARFSNSSAYFLFNGAEGAQQTTATTISMQPVKWGIIGGNSYNNNQNTTTLESQNGYWVASNMSLQEIKDFETSYKTFINNIQAYAALMDSYSGAAVAYSLRKVYSTYEGSAINVRRSSDNATQDIGFDGYVLDEAALLSFVGASDGYVTTWYDQSGNGNDATQSTAASQPQIVSSGNVITENGKPAVSFDGSNDQMNVAYSFSNTSISHILVNSYDKDLQTSTYPHFFSGVNTNYSNRLYLQGKTDLYYYSSGSGSSNGNTTGVYGSNIDNSLNIISLSLRNSGAGYSGDFNLNGNSQVAFSNASVPLQSFTSQILGNWNTTGGNTKMNVSEFIQFSSDESANLSGINSLINTYYNIY